MYRFELKLEIGVCSVNARGKAKILLNNYTNDHIVSHKIRNDFDENGK